MSRTDFENYDREGDWKLIWRGLNIFPVNLLGSETVDRYLVGVSNSSLTRLNWSASCGGKRLN